jgi:hypothetical protein
MTSRDRDDELKRDLGATLAARKDLGDDYESALVDSFLAKVDARLDQQVEKRVRRELAEQTMEHHRRSDRRSFRGRGRSGILAYGSLVFAVPLSAIAAVNTGISGLLVTWVGIVGVNVAHALPSLLQRDGEQRGPASDWED